MKTLSKCKALVQVTNWVHTEMKGRDRNHSKVAIYIYIFLFMQENQLDMNEKNKPYSLVILPQLSNTI